MAEPLRQVGRDYGLNTCVKRTKARLSVAQAIQLPPLRQLFPAKPCCIGTESAVSASSDSVSDRNPAWRSPKPSSGPPSCLRDRASRANSTPPECRPSLAWLRAKASCGRFRCESCYKNDRFYNTPKRSRKTLKIGNKTRFQNHWNIDIGLPSFVEPERTIDPTVLRIGSLKRTLRPIVRCLWNGLVAGRRVLGYLFQ